jgi:hypothetical protein
MLVLWRDSRGRVKKTTLKVTREKPAILQKKTLTKSEGRTTVRVDDSD